MNRAVIWDYDGTLVDTRRKNYRVTRRLIPAVSRRPLDSFPALASFEAYRAADSRAANWRELYGQEYGLTAEQVDEAGRSWTQYQLADDGPTPFFEGVKETLAELAGLSQAIFSQNSRQAILLALEAAGLDGYFSLVVGYEEIGLDRQKPAPDGLLHCLDQMAVSEGMVFFVGDHDSDAACARRANEVLEQHGRALRVVSIGAGYGREGGWSVRPDVVARRPGDVGRMVHGEW
jgi:HAD superfamily hydrolase (TIGR01549 family)